MRRFSIYRSSVALVTAMLAASLVTAACDRLPGSSGSPAELSPGATGTIRVMAANALNLFATIDSRGATCGPLRADCRGADSVEEYERQRAKIIATVLGSGADIVGLMEIENDDGATLDDLVRTLAAASGDDWRQVETGVIGWDTIKVGLIYNAARVEPMGRWRILNSNVDRRFDDGRNRPALAQTFRGPDGFEPVTVVVNHFKSKGSSCADIGDPDLGDGQGNCNLTRTRAAEALADWARSDPTGTGADVLIVGDLNAYQGEDPVRALEAAGYDNLVSRFVGDGAYTFEFRGRRGVLDHAFATTGLLPRIETVRIWHINAGQPRELDYNLEDGRDPSRFDSSSPIRSSDHDPVIVDLRPAN